jgi:hypothetical protein
VENRRTGRNGDRHDAVSDVPFEVTRVRKDQHSSHGGSSVFLRFYVTGPQGIHRVEADIAGFTGQPPTLKHDRELSLDNGATAHVDVRLEFDMDRTNSCTLALSIAGKRLGAFLVQPAAATRRAV